jgi:hypothetical protein
LVVVDRLSKAAHFGTLPTQFTAVKVAELFANMVCKLHGMPRSIVSDRDAIFLSQFWKELFRPGGTKLRMSSAYHPQSDGHNEIVNKVLQQYLRCFVHNQPHKWGVFLHWAEWHYNTAVHTSTGFTPFQIVYGRTPPALVDYVSGSTTLQAVEATLMERDEILQILKQKLLRAQENMKLIAAKKRIPHEFKEGDLVFVKLRPYRQNSVVGRRIHKLSKRFYGPYKIAKAIGEVAFKLELPTTSKIHPVFHASQLKPCFDTTVTPLNIPLNNEGNRPVIQPLAVIDWKQNAADGLTQVLIQWDGLFPEDATWEDYEDIRTTYPAFNLEDKVCLDEPGDDMNYDEGINPTPRPKRKIVMPKRYEGFDTWKGGKK